MKFNMIANDQQTRFMQSVDRLEAAQDLSEAINLLKAKLAEWPGYFSAWLRLSRLLFEQERFDAAIQAVKQAEAVDPLVDQFQLIQRALQAGDLQQAQAIAQSMLQNQPGHPRAIFTLAHVAQLKNDFEAVVAHLRDGVSHAPASLTLRGQLITALEQCGAYQDALAAGERLAEIAPGFETLFPLISLYLRYGRNEAGLRACDEALGYTASDPARNSALALVRGQILRILGDQDGSIAALKSSLAANPGNGDAWWSLADMKTYAFNETEKSEITALLTRRDVNRAQKSLALFALAKAHEDDTDWSTAMPLYAKANQLQPQTFDAAKFDAASQRLIKAFTPQTLAQQAVLPPHKARPIFIVGLPRSGSTLVEQILASHSQIEGTMEQPTLPAIKRKAHLECVQRFHTDYLNAVGQLSADSLQAHGQDYLKSSQFFRNSARPLFTDKLPYNFEHVGLIHKILPEALIIDVRRHPLDCGLSLFKQHFSQGVGFSYDLKSIGAYYNGYLQIMDHWDAVLPGMVFHIRYEELVRSPEPVIRALLSHLGVEFEDACLQFHTTRRAVRTASSEQVRQPMNTQGIEVWRKAEPYLADLKTALGAETLARFESDPGSL